MEDQNVFGAKLRELRKKRGYSLQQLADRLSQAQGRAEERTINKSYISDMERGTKPPPSRKQIARLNEALQTTEDESQELYVSAGYVPPELWRALSVSDQVAALRRRVERA
ncbi:MAG: helix-turn-helix domain-containing protein [Armatimonadetes bacterium]|nr:helix-turn-helix domain-containing protein [Armatimonadota bacterium]